MVCKFVYLLKKIFIFIFFPPITHNYTTFFDTFIYIMLQKFFITLQHSNSIPCLLAVRYISPTTQASITLYQRLYLSFPLFSQSLQYCCSPILSEKISIHYCNILLKSQIIDVICLLSNKILTNT